MIVILWGQTVQYVKSMEDSARVSLVLRDATAVDVYQAFTISQRVAAHVSILRKMIGERLLSGYSLSGLKKLKHSITYRTEVENVLFLLRRTFHTNT